MSILLHLSCLYIESYPNARASPLVRCSPPLTDNNLRERHVKRAMESSQALHAEHSTKDPLIANELGSTSTSSQDEQARGNWHSVPQVTYGSYAQPYPAYVHGQGPVC